MRALRLQDYHSYATILRNVSPKYKVRILELPRQQYYSDIAHHCLLLKHKNAPKEARTPDLDVNSLTL